MGEGSSSVIGYVALGLLVAQNTTVVLLTKATKLPGQERYSSVAVVMLTELMKLAICCVVVSFEGPGLYADLRDKVLSDRVKLLQLSVPSLLYVVQNNLLYVAIGNLTPAVFQVTYQLKLILSAGLTVVAFDRKLLRRQWGAIALLFGGIALCNKPSKRGGGGGGGGGGDDPEDADQPVLGVLAAVGASAISAMAGVFMEKVLKGKEAKPADPRGAAAAAPQSLWLKNVQLSAYGLIFSLGACAQQFGWVARARAALAAADADGAPGAPPLAPGADDDAPGPPAMLDGFTLSVVGIVFLQAAGGLVSAAVLKFADNILKNFATSISTVLCAVLSVFLFDFRPTSEFFVGAFCVLTATQIYNLDTSGSEERAAAAWRRAAVGIGVFAVVAVAGIAHRELASTSQDEEELPPKNWWSGNLEEQ